MRHTRQHSATSTRGIILLATTLVTAGLTVITTVGLTRAYTDLLASQTFLRHTQALYGAEAAVDAALAQLRADLLDGTWTFTDTGVLTTPSADAQATVTALSTSGGTSLTNGDRLLITAIGTPTIGGVAQPQLSRTIQAVIEAQALWAYAFLGTGIKPEEFTEDWHVLNDATIDAYDAALDSYTETQLAELTAQPPPPPGGSGDGSSLEKTASTPHLFAIGNNTEVTGSVFHMPTLPARVVTNEPGAITEGLQTLTTAPTPVAATIPPKTPAIDTLEIIQKGDSSEAYLNDALVAFSVGEPLQVVVPPALYVEQLIVTGSSTSEGSPLNVQFSTEGDGGATLYIESATVTGWNITLGPATLSGASLPSSSLQWIGIAPAFPPEGPPSARSVLSSYPQFDFGTNRSTFTLLLLAGEITLNGRETNFLGAMQGKRLKMTGGHLHYDTRLQNMLTPHVLAWLDTGTLGGSP